MIGQHHGPASLGDGLLRHRHALGDAMHLGAGEQIRPPPPGPAAHVARDAPCELRLAVGDDLEGHAGIGHVAPGEAEIDIDEDVRLARFPGQRALHQVRPGRGAGPLQHGGREDRQLQRDMRGHVVATDGAHQHPRGALALQVHVVVREVLHAERHVGVAEEFRILVAMRVEGRGDARLWPQCVAHAARDLGFRPRHAAHAHRAMQREVGAVEGAEGAQLLELPAEEGLEGLVGDPARSRSGLRPERGVDADQLHPVEFARDLHEAAHVALGIGGEQRLACRGRAGVAEILLRRVEGQEGDGLVRELQDGDAHGLRTDRRDTVRDR